MKRAALFAGVACSVLSSGKRHADARHLRRRGAQTYSFDALNTCCSTLFKNVAAQTSCFVSFFLIPPSQVFICYRRVM